MKQETKDFLHLHFIVLVWGFSVILGLLISIPAVEVVFFRTAIAVLGLFIVLILRKKSFQLSAGKSYFTLFGTGALIAAHWILFFLSAKISNASVCLAGMATCSLWTSLLEPISYGRKVKGFEVLLSIVAFVGIAIIFNVEFDYLVGLLTAVISAFIASIFTVINERYTKKYDPYVITFYEMLGAFLSVFLFLPFYGMYLVENVNLFPSGSDWIYIALLAIFCTVYAFSISVELMKRLSAFSVNLIVNLEPVYGIILALLIFGSSEEMSSGFYLGTFLILVSVLLYPVLNKRYNKKALSTDIIR